MADRAPLPSIAGLLSGHIDRNLTIGASTLPTTLERMFVSLTDPSAIGPVTVEFRVAGVPVLTATILTGNLTRTEIPAEPIQITAITPLSIVITDAPSDALGFWGWWGKADVGASAPPAGFDLTTLEIVKQYLSVETSSTDDNLQRIITAVSQAMRNVIGQDPSTDVIVGERYSARCSPELQLKRWPVQSIEEIRIDGTALAAGTWDLEGAQGLVIHGAPGSPSYWPWGYRHIEVDYTAGYAAIPVDLQEAATIQTAWQYKRTGDRGGRLGERSTIVGDATATYLIDDWAPEVRSTLDRYRSVWAG